jgi:succinate dehydrogenase/fumarate reductase iron-sulfur protein
VATTGSVVRVQVARSDAAARDRFEVPRSRALVILDLLVEIGHEDDSLGYRYSCRSGFCGTCTVLLDGHPVLACQTAVPAGDRALHLAPLGGFPVVRDLVVDPAPFAERWTAVEPRIVPAAAIDGDRIAHQTGDDDDAGMDMAPGPRPVDPSGRAAIEDSLDCISCGACFAACDLSSAERPYLGPAALTRAMVVLGDAREAARDVHWAAVSGPDGIEGCHGIGACSLACPKGLDPARAIRRLRRWRITGHRTAGHA